LTAKQHGFYYHHNSKTWMTGLFFWEWLHYMDEKMRSQNRKVLLLLDNAPPHTAAGKEFNNLEVGILPPNTTSKIQPMDAGIIAAFKRQYWNFQLQDAIDKDEAGATDIYKVDQLSAMRWCKRAWRSISSDTIANCFRHTGLFDDVEINWDEDGTGQLPIGEQVIEEELATAIATLHVQHPMDIKDLLNPPVEDLFAHHIFTDEELLDIAVPAILDDGKEDDEPEDSGIVAPPAMELREKLHIIQATIQLLDVTRSEHAQIHKGLRNFQRELREKGLRQTALDQFFLPGHST